MGRKSLRYAKRSEEPGRFLPVALMGEACVGPIFYIDFVACRGCRAWRGGGTNEWTGGNFAHAVSVGPDFRAILFPHHAA